MARLTTMELTGSNILRSDAPIVYAAIDEFVGGVGRHVGNLNLVLDLEVFFAIGALSLGYLVGGNAAQVCFDIDELSHAFCRQCWLISLLSGC